MQEPDPFNVKNFKKWLRHDQEEVLEIDIGGDGEENTWGELYSAKGLTKRLPFWERCFEFLWHRVWPHEIPGNELDLLVIQPPAKLGIFTRWVIDYFIPFWEELRHPNTRKTPEGEEDLEKNESIPSAPEEEEDWLLTEGRQGNVLAQISDRVVAATGFFSMMLACWFPVIAVTVLAQLHRVKDLLGALAGFVVIFAIGLQVITGGEIRSLDVFSATAV